MAVNLNIARKIMGENFLGLEDLARHLHISFAPQEPSQFSEVPFPQVFLEENSQTHILFPGYALSINDMARRAPRSLQFIVRNIGSLGLTKVESRWYLLAKCLVPGSFGKTLKEQLLLLHECQEMPRACELVYAVLLWFLARGGRLFGFNWLSCRDEAEKNYRWCVGGGDSSKINVMAIPDEQNLSIGLAPSIQPCLVFQG